MDIIGDKCAIMTPKPGLYQYRQISGNNTQ